MRKPKEKKERETEEGVDDQEDILSQIKKEYSNILVSEEDLIKERSKAPTGIFSLDYRLAGGLPRGRMALIHAEEGVIKTTLLLLFIAESQRRGEICAFIDMEGGFDEQWAKKLGVDIDKLLYFRPDFAEKAFEIVMSLCKLKNVGVVGIDSMANMVPKCEVEKDMDEMTVGVQAKLNAYAFRKLALPMLRSGMVLICLNQRREKIGIMFGKTDTTSGGHALKHAASTEISLKVAKYIEDKSKKIDDADIKDKIYAGKYIMFKIEKSRFCKPLQTGLIDFYFNGSIDNISAVLICGLLNGTITTEGRTYSFQGEKIGIGKDNALEYLRECPEMVERIKFELEKDM